MWREVARTLKGEWRSFNKAWRGKCELDVCCGGPGSEREGKRVCVRAREPCKAYCLNLVDGGRERERDCEGSARDPKGNVEKELKAVVPAKRRQAGVEAGGEVARLGGRHHSGREGEGGEIGREGGRKGGRERERERER